MAISRALALPLPLPQPLPNASAAAKPQDAECCSSGLPCQQRVAPRLTFVLAHFRPLTLCCCARLWRRSGCAPGLCGVRAGQRLGDRERLLPLASLVTPNLREAEVLLGWRAGSILDLATMRDAALQISRLGPRCAPSGLLPRWATLLGLSHASYGTEQGSPWA